VDQVLNGAINYYNSTLTTAYNRIASLEAEVTCLWGELTRFPRENIERVQRGITHWDKQDNDIPAPNCMLKVQEEIIKDEDL